MVGDGEEPSYLDGVHGVEVVGDSHWYQCIESQGRC